MSFYNFKNLPFTLNNFPIPTTEVSISQKNNLINPFLLGEKMSFDSVPEGPFQGNLSISYLLTGLDFIKSVMDVSDNYPLSGNFGGILIDNLYLTSYSIQGEPNNPITVNAQFQFFNELSGTFHSSQSASIPQNVRWLNCNNITLSESLFNELNISNLLNFSWSYSADITPVYYGLETGIKQLQPFRVVFGEKTIQSSFTSEVNNITLPFTGQNYLLNIAPVHPITNTSYQTFTCSGKINTKTISSNINSPSIQEINITQKNINATPTIVSIGLLDNNSITTGLEIYANNMRSTDGYDINYVENIYLGNKLLTTTSIDDNYITTAIPNDAINGILKVETTKGNVIYPSQTNLNYPNIIISGFSPSGGQPNSIVDISGANFYGITDVYFGNNRARFQVNRDSLTGSLHRIVTTVPEISTIDYIYVISSTRNKSGISNQTFAPNLTFSSFTPTTGQWGDIITFSGKNFTGISGVLFNGVPSHSFRVTGNNFFTGAVPLSGSGYTKGYITLVTNYGQRANSKNIYRPVVPIYSISVRSGKINDAIGINTKVDPDFFYAHNNTGRLTVTNLLASDGEDFFNGEYTGIGTTFVSPNGSNLLKVGSNWRLRDNGANIYYEKTEANPYDNPSTIWTQSAGIGTPHVLLRNYVVMFGNVTGTMAKWGSGILTGLLPSGNFHNQNIALLEPNGVDRYPNNLSGFYQIGPPPEITTPYVSDEPTLWMPHLVGMKFYKYKFQTVSLNGRYMKDFFGLPWYLSISGQGLAGYGGSGFSGTFSNVSGNGLMDKVMLNNIRMTGGSPGRYNMELRNFAGGTTAVNGVLLLSGIDLMRGTTNITPATISHYPTQNRSVSERYPAGRAADGNDSTYSQAAPTGGHRSSYYTVQFSAATPISFISISQHQIPLTHITGMSTSLVNRLSTTGYIEFYDNSDLLMTGVSGILFNAYNLTSITSPITGVRRIRIFNSGSSATTHPIFMAFKTISVY